MKRKFLAILFVSGCIDLLMLACCPGPYYGYLKIEDIAFENEILGASTSERGPVSFEDFSLTCKFETSSITSTGFNGAFMTAAYATTCPRDGEMGLKLGIKMVTLSATVELLGIPAGQPINVNNNIRVYSDFKHSSDSDPGLTFANWIEELNTDFYSTWPKWYFKFREEISSDTLIKFRIRLTFEDGSMMDAETKSIQIQ